MLFGGEQADTNPQEQSRTTSTERESWTSWLNRTERETWQMELLISGFVIVLLSQAFEPLGRHLNGLRANAGNAKIAEAILLTATVALLFGLLITIVSLGINVLLRGLWIGAVGLRSVSGDIDFDNLGLAPRYTKFLRRRIVSFDDYILQLERVCSSIFSLAFLTIFTLCGVLLAGLTIAIPAVLVTSQLTALQPSSKMATAAVIAMGAVIVLVSLGFAMTAIDFLTGSRVKRSERLSRVYFPVWRFVGWITLARFYRPLYYNLIDHRFGRWVVFAIVPYFAIVVTAATYTFEGLTPGVPRVDDFGFGASRNYGVNSAGYFPEPFLAERVVEGAGVTAYLPLEWNLGSLATQQCDSLQSDDEEYLDSGDALLTERLEKLRAYTACLAGFWQIQLDGRPMQKPGYILTEYGETGLSCLMTVLPLDGVGPGPHHISFLRAKKERDTYFEVITIPFVKL